MADELSCSVSCEKTETTLCLHNFSEQLMDQTVNFQVLKMTDSIFLWIGTAAEMANLAVAMCTKYEGVPAVSSILGNTADLSSSTLAQRLAKRTGKQCFVSCNVLPENILLGLVENRINQEITEKPEKF